MKFLCIAAGGNNTLIETTRKRSDDHWSQSHNTLPAPRRRKITHAPAFKEQHFQPFCGNDQSANRESFNFQLSPNYYEPRMPLDLPNEEQQGRHLGHQTEPYRREPTFATPQNVLSIPESSTGPNETRQSPISDPHFSPVAGLAHNNQSNNRIDYRPQAEISGPMYYPPVWNNPMQYPSNSNNPYNPQFQTGDPALDRSISSPQSFNHLPDSIQFNSTYRNLNESIDPQLSLLSTTGPQGSPAHTAPTSGFQISQYNVSFVHPDLSAHPQRSTADHHSIIAAPDLGVPRSSSSDEALQYKMQAAVLTAPAEIQKESQDRAPSRHDDIRVALEASMDEAFPFEGCFVLTPTSTDIRSGKSYASGFPKRTPSKQKPPRKPMKVEERAAVQHNRKNGVCVRCKLYKERVCHVISICSCFRLLDKK